MSTAIASEFKRFEDKFLIPMGFKDELMNEINNHLVPSIVVEGTEFTEVQSIYFDSEKLDFLVHHLSYLSERCKVRIRRYAPNGVLGQENSFVEVKMKGEGVSKKFRFEINKKQYQTLLSGQKLQIDMDLLEVNDNLSLSKVRSRVEMVNSLIDQYQLKPKVFISYKRKAFEEEDLRVTVDEEIKGSEFESLNGPGKNEIQSQQLLLQRLQDFYQLYAQGDYLVLEVKHQGESPEWLSKFLSQKGIEKQGFSKYCWYASTKLWEYLH